MTEPTFASLNPSLLARKGGAKPAMRPQHALIPQHSTEPEPLEDLGWNDMGSGEEHQDSQDNVVPLATSENEVRRRQRQLARKLEAAPEAPERRSAASRGKRAAFTLRLDSERHLKLRLACTLNNRSAQQLVTEALDRLIADMPDVASLAAQVKQN
jgi:hypothetical protein